MYKLCLKIERNLFWKKCRVRINYFGECGNDWTQKFVTDACSKFLHLLHCL
jgi:hypothetical protein